MASSSSQSQRALQLRVGALVAVAVALAAVFVIVLGKVSFRGGYPLYVDFDFSGNLQPGAPVKVSGIKVGKVEEVAFLGGRFDESVQRRVQVRVKLWVEAEAKDAIRQDAAFFVNTQGVLGEQYLEIAPGQDFDHPPLAAGAIREGDSPPRADLIVARLYQFLDAVTRILADDKDAIQDFLRSGASLVRTLDGVLKENHGQIARLLKNVDQLTADAAALVDAVRRGVGDPATLRRTLANLEALTDSIRRDIDPLIARTKKALDGVEQVTSIVGPGEKQKLARALDELVQLAARVDAVAGDVQAIVGDVRRGKGTAGALVVDPQVYDDLKELVRDLKRNPWKFFWKE